MKGIKWDESLGEDRHLAILEVHYPDPADWDVEAFNKLKESELGLIREEGAEYDRRSGRPHMSQ